MRSTLAAVYPGPDLPATLLARTVPRSLDSLPLTLVSSDYCLLYPTHG